MRLDNVPFSVALTLVAALSLFVGFPAALPWGVGVYVVALAALLAYALSLPAYNHATRAPRRLAVFGMTSTLATAYLAARLAVFNPEDLLFLGSVPWLGAVVTVVVLWFVPVFLQILLFTILRRTTVDKGAPAAGEERQVQSG